MEVRASDQDFSEIFAHQEWVRRLALRLCGDPTAADDLVQDTWIEALRGGTGARSVRSWLGGIVRHRWRRDRLRSNARAEREASVARNPEMQSSEMPNAEGLLAQAELQRRVLAAVASLDEASRTVVLLRYYEGLSSEAIAARLSMPSSTVRNRLARAHEKLRAVLDREHGGREWSALFLPAASQHVSSLPASIGVAMKLKLAASVALLAAGSAWWWFASHAADQNAAESQAALVQSPASQERPIETAAAISEPVSPGNRAPAPALADRRNEPLLLFGSLQGPTAAQAADSTLRLIDADGRSREVSAGANATYSAFDVRPGTARLYVNVRGFVPKEEELDLSAASGPVQHDVTLVPAFMVPVRFVDRTTGGPLISAKEFRGPRIAAIATRERPLHVANVLGRVPWGGDAGNYRAREPFGGDSSLPEGCDGVLEVRPPFPAWVSFVLRDTVIDSRLVHGNEKEIVFEMDRAELDAALGTLRLVCVESTSRKPVEGASVGLTFQDGGQETATTNAGGEAVLQKLSPGLQKLNITAKGMGTCIRIVRVLSRETTDLGTIELKPSSVVSGRVLDENGQPLEARVSVFPLRPNDAPRGAHIDLNHPCGPGGEFKITDIERGPCRIVAQAKGFGLRILDADSSAGDLEPFEIRLQRGTPVRFRSAQDAGPFVEFLLTDAKGVPIQLVTASRVFPRELVLAPGGYQAWSLEDERVVSRMPFEVGSVAMSCEVR